MVVRANKEKILFYTTPTMLPTSNRTVFFTNFPLNGKIKDIKRKSKIISIAADSLLTLKKNKIEYVMTAPAKIPKPRCRIFNALFLSNEVSSVSSPSRNLELNYRRLI